MQKIKEVVTKMSVQKFDMITGIHIWFKKNWIMLFFMLSISKRLLEDPEIPKKSNKNSPWRTLAKNISILQKLNEQFLVSKVIDW